MKQILLKTWLILVCLLTGAGTMWAEKITDYTNIVSGKKYYIGATTSNTDYYLSVDGSSTSTSIAGTAVTNKANATAFVFEGSGTSWTIKFDGTSNYLGLNSSKDNGKVKVVSSAATFTLSNQSKKIRLTIGSYSVQKNNSGTQFGSYGNTQTDIWLEEVSSGGSTKYNVTVANNIANGTVTASPTSAAEGATVTLTATPSTGYEFGSWNVTNASTSAAITVTNNKFTMPAADVNVSATFNQVQGGVDEPSGDASATLDFTTNTWSFPEGSNNKAIEDKTFTDGSYTIILGNASTSGYYFNTDGYLILGKSGATLTLPVFDFDVERIIVHGRGGASASVGQNIFVDETAVSTATAGAQTSNVYEIASAYQAAGNVYVLKVTTSANTQITKIEIYAKEGTDPDQPIKETPSLSFSSATYNATMGEGFVAPTLTNEQGVTVSYSSSAEGVATVNATTGAISLVAPGKTTITAYFAGDETYTEASASYQLVVAPAPVSALTTMDAIYAKAQEVNGAETEVHVTFNNWVVSGVNGSNVYVTDGTKGFIVYTSGHGFVAGDILSGTVTSKIKLFNNAAEFVGLKSTTEGLIVTTGGSAAEQNIAIADLAGINTGALVAYENLTYHLNGTSAEFSDGENVIVAYKGIMNALPELVEGKTYDVKGVFLMYGTKKEILPRSAEDIVLKDNIKNYTISYAATENGTIVVKNGDTPLTEDAQVAEGTTLTIECTPANENYRFVNWQYKAEGMAAFATRTKEFTYTMPSANVQFKATFEEIPVYTVTYMSLGSPAGTEQVKEGNQIANAPSVSLTDWTFVGWTTNGSYTDSETAPALFDDAITEATTLYAVFSQGENGAAGSASLTNDEICNKLTGSYADGSITNTYGTWNYNAAKQGNVNKDGEYFLQLRNNATISYLQIPEMAGNITSIVLGRVCNTTKEKYTGSIYFRSEKSNDATAIATATQSTALTDVTLIIPEGYKTGYVMVSGACRIESVTVNYTTGGTKTYTITGPLPAYGELAFVATSGNNNYYATFSCDRDVIFSAEDEAIEVQTVAVVEGGLLVEAVSNNSVSAVTDKTKNEGWVAGFFVPANTGVLVYSIGNASAKYYYAEANEENVRIGVDADNMLVSASIPMAGDCKFYKLAYGDWTNKAKLGFWWGADNGAKFDCKPGTAYLAVPNETAAGSNMRGFSFEPDERPTGIDANGAATEGAEIYNLQGQRINRLQQGVNIVNGRKVIR